MTRRTELSVHTARSNDGYRHSVTLTLHTGAVYTRTAESSEPMSLAQVLKHFIAVAALTPDDPVSFFLETPYR